MLACTVLLPGVFQARFSHGYSNPEVKNKLLLCLPVPELCCTAEAVEVALLLL